MNFRKRLANWWLDFRYHIYYFPGKWWVLHRIHPRHRYHVAITGLKPGYYDPEDRIEHTIVNEFLAYMKEHGLLMASRYIPEDCDDDNAKQSIVAQQKRWDEMAGIYHRLKDVNLYDIEESSLTEILVYIVENRGMLWYSG